VAAGLVRTLRSEAKPDPLALLSARERDVLLLIAEGLSNQSIAERLGIGEATVKTHVGNLLSKLELSDRTQAAVWAWRQKLVSPP
jgi:NarL family two-component system response regulator LiaR